jgi:hypothetical protein
MTPALNLEEWSLSASAMAQRRFLGTIAQLNQEPEITSALVIARQRHPFPAGYTPAVVDVLFDDVLFIRSDRRNLVFLRTCSPHYEPPFVEVRFDDQMALFWIQGEVVVNRTQAMAELDQLLGRFAPSQYGFITVQQLDYLLDWLIGARLRSIDG